MTSNISFKLIFFGIISTVIVMYMMYNNYTDIQDNRENEKQKSSYSGAYNPDSNWRQELKDLREDIDITWDNASVDNTKLKIDEWIESGRYLDEVIILYRGVSKSHIHYSFALLGTALPGGHNNPEAHDDPIYHNKDGSETSVFVSLAMTIEKAYMWAEDGVILVTKQSLRNLTISPDVYCENEYLHRGPIYDCVVIPVDNYTEIYKYML